MLHFFLTGKQARRKKDACPDLFDSDRTLFVTFGFDYANPFTRMNIVGRCSYSIIRHRPISAFKCVPCSYSIGMGYLEFLSLPLRREDEEDDSRPFGEKKSLRRKAAHRELLMLLDGGCHPKNLQPYLEPVLIMMVKLEIDGMKIGTGTSMACVHEECYH